MGLALYRFSCRKPRHHRRAGGRQGFVAETAHKGTFNGLGLGLWSYYSIKEDEVAPLIAFTNEMENAPREFVEVALRRFHQSFDRDLPEDQAIDLCVALECLFSEDREAIGYKIALRAAYLLETDPEKRKALFTFLRQAYRERSNVVHGTGSRPSWRTKENNADKLADIVRSALRQLLQHAKQGKVLKTRDLDHDLFFAGR